VVGASFVETLSNLAPNVADVLCESAARLRAAPKHPHLATILAVERRDGECAITSEESDGIAAAEVFFRLSLAARLRIVVDVLAGLSALHQLKIVHGGVLLRATFVDASGRARLGRAYARAVCMKKDAYAPESLLGDDAAIGARTDVYGAGVMLWEAISGRELFGVDAPENILKKQLGGRIATALPPARDRWATTVLPVIERALAVNPEERFATIAEMAAALRIAVRARLMTHEDVVEEIWPAATTPKVQSGVQPASEPIVADARDALQVVPTPSAPLAVSLDPREREPSAPHETFDAPLAPPKRSRRAIAVFSALALASACAIFALVHARASHTSVARETATAITEDPQMAIGAPTPTTPMTPSAAAEPANDTKPGASPPAATTTAAPVRKSKPKPHRGEPYDPSSI
jgi:serine/threonine-protein kinase